MEIYRHCKPLNTLLDVTQGIVIVITERWSAKTDSRCKAECWSWGELLLGALEARAPEARAPETQAPEALVPSVRFQCPADELDSHLRLPLDFHFPSQAPRALELREDPSPSLLPGPCIHGRAEPEVAQRCPCCRLGDVPSLP